MTPAYRPSRQHLLYALAQRRSKLAKTILNPAAVAEDIRGYLKYGVRLELRNGFSPPGEGGAEAGAGVPALNP